MYCLEDYNSYALEGSQSDEVYRELQLTFEACKNKSGCKSLEEIESYLQGKVFRFPIEDSILNLFGVNDE